MKNEFTFLEFFAGGGMARLGLGDSWRCLFANDIDPQKCASYQANFGQDITERDIALIDINDLPKEQVDLAWGSFPCQDLSLAGARGGITARRSSAFFQFWRLMEDLQKKARAPRAVVLENVIGLLTSNGGGDFRVICEQLVSAGYRVTALALDAKLFTPQSRPRLFIFGFDASTSISMDAVAPLGTAPPALRTAYDLLPASVKRQWVGITCAPTTKRNIRFADIIDWNAPQWDRPAHTEKLISMMSDKQRERLNGIVNHGARRAGAAFRRTRIENGKPVQRVEARFDGLAGCLRTPAGGSSRQIVIAIEKGVVRTRLITPREAARLMGLPEEYELPQSATAALKLCGDGVCVPVVRWLAETILTPALSTQHVIAAA